MGHVGLRRVRALATPRLQIELVPIEVEAMLDARLDWQALVVRPRLGHPQAGRCLARPEDATPQLGRHRQVELSEARAAALDIDAARREVDKQREHARALRRPVVRAMVVVAAGQAKPAGAASRPA